MGKAKKFLLLVLATMPLLAAIACHTSDPATLCNEKLWHAGDTLTSSQLETDAESVQWARCAATTTVGDAGHPNGGAYTYSVKQSDDTVTAYTWVEPANVEGDVDFFFWTKSASNFITNSPTDAQKQFMRDHYADALVFGPSASNLSSTPPGYWDTRLAWYGSGDPNGVANEYVDAYAIKESEILQNPVLDSYVLRDSTGRKVYINYECDGTECSQYAADIGNPAYRQWYLGQVQRNIDAGYPGLFMDDVNLRMWFSSGSTAPGNNITPINPRTNAPMTTNEWRNYFAEFLDLVRTTYPNLNIIHNSIWYVDQNAADNDTGIKFGDTRVDSQIADSDFTVFEHGCDDGGLKASGDYSLDYLFNQADRIHSLGSNVIWMDEASSSTVPPYSTSPAKLEHELACFLQVNDGNDMIGSEAYGTSTNPGPVYPAEPYWWDGWDVDLGAAIDGNGDGSTKRYDWVSNGQTFIRRDFENGFVVTREPQLATASFTVPAGYERIDGTAAGSSITLAARNSAVLLEAT